MANRWFNQFRLSLEKQVVDLFARVTFGAAGAPTLVTSASKGIASIVRNGAGDYTVTFQDSYVGLLMIDNLFDTSGIGGVSPASPDMYLKAQAVTTTPGGTVRIVFITGAGAATDPASGEAVYLQFILKNSTAQ